MQRLESYSAWSKKWKHHSNVKNNTGLWRCDIYEAAPKVSLYTFHWTEVWHLFELRRSINTSERRREMETEGWLPAHQQWKVVPYWPIFSTGNSRQVAEPVLKLNPSVGLQTPGVMLASGLQAGLQCRARSHVYILVTSSLVATLDNTLTRKNSSLRCQSLQGDSSGFQD